MELLLFNFINIELIKRIENTDKTPRKVPNLNSQNSYHAPLMSNKPGMANHRKGARG